MGQRLNIEIKESETMLANAYYHWSGYTSSAFSLAKTILEGIDGVQEENKTLRAVKILELSGAKLTEKEIEEINKLLGEAASQYTFEIATDRNYGLISVTQEGIKETQRWEEARVEIDIVDRTVYVNAFWTVGEDDEVAKEKLENAPVIEGLTDEIPFDNFSEVAQQVFDAIETDIYYAKNSKDSETVGFIE